MVDPLYVYVLISSYKVTSQTESGRTLVTSCDLITSVKAHCQVHSRSEVPGLGCHHSKVGTFSP